MSQATEEYDPFDEFNRAQGQGTIADPYAGFAALRASAPIVQMPIPPIPEAREALGNDATEIWIALSHNAVSEVLRDGERFSSAGYSQLMGPVMGRTILEMDEPEHSRYRGLLQQAFTRKALERWERDLVHPVVHGLIDAFEDRGRADLVRELTFPFPVTVIAGMIGLPEEDHSTFHRLAVELISVQINRERGLAASAKLAELFARVLAERRAEPKDDLMSVLAGAELDGTHLTDEEIFAFLRLLAPAGAETTYRSSSNLFFGLLSNPDQLDAVRADRSLVPQAIEEGLRWECPLTGIMRTATRDTEVQGVKIPAGALIQTNMASANRDPSRYEDPDRFDIFRPQKQHLAFAFGPHRCLGMHLARMESRVVVEAVLDRLPGVRLDPAAEDVHITGLAFRSPLALPVVFDPA